MADRNFTHFADHLARGRINYATATVKGIIVTVAPTEANIDTWDYRDDITNEAPATGGYVTGGFAVTASIGAVDAANDRVPVTFSAASPTYSNSTITGVGVVIYIDTGVAGTSPVCHYVEFDEGEESSTNGNFTVTFSAPLYINAA
jgi:hypothetical protein